MAAVSSAILRALKVRRTKGPVALSVLWFKASRTSDIDNRSKCLLDALKDRAFEDDRHVACLRLERVEGCPTPHMRVMVYGWTQRIWPEWATGFPSQEDA